jgi:glutathione S-transferase
MIKVSAFHWVPPFAQGLVRDLRVRWALEEAGLDYTERLLGPADQASAEYRSLQPFGQVPTLEHDDVTLFESGAIVLHIAAASEALLPSDPQHRARAISWLFAALNTVEVPIGKLAEMDLFHAEEEWCGCTGGPQRRR